MLHALTGDTPGLDVYSAMVPEMFNVMCDSMYGRLATNLRYSSYDILPAVAGWASFIVCSTIWSKSVRAMTTSCSRNVAATTAVRSPVLMYPSPSQS